MTGPSSGADDVLAGITIVSVALNLPGPAALMRLRAMGAHCIKIEPPGAAGGDPMQLACPVAYASMHDGVDVHEIDLKATDGRDRLDTILAGADVFLTSFRPAALDRLGLGWSALHDRFPKLSLVSIVGSAGDAAAIPGHDLTYVAAAGLLPGMKMPATLYADMAGSVFASEAVLKAVIAKGLRGKGVFYEVALENAAIYTALPASWGLTMPGALLGGGHAGYKVYPCLNGRVALAALEPRFFESLLRCAGLPAGSSPTTSETHEKCERFIRSHTAEELETLAVKNDLPLFTLGASKDR